MTNIDEAEVAEIAKMMTEKTMVVLTPLLHWLNHCKLRHPDIFEMVLFTTVEAIVQNFGESKKGRAELAGKIIVTLEEYIIKLEKGDKSGN